MRASSRSGRSARRASLRSSSSGFRRAIAEGLRWVFGNAYLRRIVGTTAVSNLFGTVSFTVLPLLLLRELGFSPAQMGIVFGLSSVGGLLGALATPHLVRLVGEARAIPVSSRRSRSVSASRPGGCSGA